MAVDFARSSGKGDFENGWNKLSSARIRGFSLSIGLALAEAVPKILRKCLRGVFMLVVVNLGRKPAHESRRVEDLCATSVKAIGVVCRC